MFSINTVAGPGSGFFLENQKSTGGIRVKFTGSRILMETLIEEGVDTIFGYPGGAVLDIYDEIYKTRIKHILVRHEQGAAHAADGYARASGRVGVCLVTSGPGATNTVTGIATAYMDSVPMVIFTGQVPTSQIGTDAFQEADITGITRPCTKHNFLVRHVEDLAGTIRDAFHIARSGRPGPVLVDLPKDVMQAETEFTEAISSKQDMQDSVVPDTDQLHQTLGLIKESKKPLVLTGGGVILGGASKELKEFARMLRLPVASTLMGIGGFPGTDPLWLGILGMHGTFYANMAISNCDLLIAFGVRFSDRITGKLSEFAPNAKIVQVDIDAASINKVVPAHIPIVGDCRPAIQWLSQQIKENSYTVSDKERKGWLDQIGAWKSEAPLRYGRSESIKPQSVIEKLHQLTNGNAIVATEVGQNQIWAAHYYHLDRPNNFLTSGGLGTMGYGFPAAIGAQAAFPDRTVVDIAGDGSIQMNIQELATAVNYKLPVKIVILNNGYLGMVRQWQELFYDKRYSHTKLTQIPDFVKVAEAYGAVGLRAEKPEKVESTLRKGLETPGPVIMDFVVDPEEGVFPMVTPGSSLKDISLG
ncbi:MAG: biosynthetic-type acetolactate synthase large subunit [Syntrophobacterales bacterium]|nr:biosynthetic-type acetolactate synthase large subunit [Syntrophobacterales bacterium]